MSFASLLLYSASNAYFREFSRSTESCSMRKLASATEIVDTFALYIYREPASRFPPALPSGRRRVVVAGPTKPGLWLNCISRPTMPWAAPFATSDCHTGSGTAAR